MNGDFSSKITRKLRGVLPEGLVGILKDARGSLYRHGLFSGPDEYLYRVGGIIHVGANDGYERDLYGRLDLNILWVEAIPDVFNQLQENIANFFPRQRAVRALLTDIDDNSYDFNIANNGGQSSSIYDLSLHKDIWPSVQYTHTLTLRSKTMRRLISDEGIDINEFQALVLDTQGSELLVLKGAEEFLEHFKYIKTEVADFEAYKGGCLLSDMTRYLEDFGFREVSRVRFARRKDGGDYYDVIYRR